MKKSPNLYPGFTFLEIGSVVVVIGIIGVGLIMTFQTIMGAYRLDVIRNDIRHYGNTIVRDISERIRTAEQVEFSSWLGFAKIDIWEDATTPAPSHVIQANEEDGVLLNFDPFLDGTLRFPVEGEWRENEQYKIKLERFDTYEETEPLNRPSLNKVKRSTRYIDLVLSLEPKTNPNTAIEKEEFQFKRNVFISSQYLAEFN